MGEFCVQEGNFIERLGLPLISMKFSLLCRSKSSLFDIVSMRDIYIRMYVCTYIYNIYRNIQINFNFQINMKIFGQAPYYSDETLF